MDEIPLKRLIGRGVNIDVTHTPARGVTTVEDVKRFENEHGELKEGDIVCFRFGWDKKWKAGEEGKAFMEDWPGISKETAEYLLSKKVSAAATEHPHWMRSELQIRRIRFFWETGFILLKMW